MDSGINNINIAGIVTYNPDIQRLTDNLTNLAKYADTVVIVDNNSSNVQTIKDVIDSLPGIILIQNSTNKGIANALNQIVSKSVDDLGASWTLLMDQDSVFKTNPFAEFGKYIGDDIAIVCPAIHDDNYGTFKTKDYTVTEIGICITSGSYINNKVWKNVCGFDDRLFIDSVDTDYSIKVTMAGYKTLRIGSVCLNHELGHTEKHLFKSATNHNAIRRYYIARNSYYLSLCYSRIFKLQGLKQTEINKINSFFDHHTSPSRVLLRQLQFVLIVILYEKNKIKKIKAIFNGLKEGLEMFRKENIQIPSYVNKKNFLIITH